ncbi:hypothetical protein PENSTE_c020G00484 [Penicillium steckii]|uniref:Uncharacterized protein n=1 Tax=Penicillium steckii TaxID=303698 RepID=A0A1V6SV52_9EURO|nr:hypothetical protein PENSTE_c020G00484 [Penicillium steckii]
MSNKPDSAGSGIASNKDTSMSDSDDESDASDTSSAQDAHAERIETIQSAIDAIAAFMKKDNRALYPIDLKIEPLNDGLYGLGGNYDNWLSGLEVLSRLHRVWPVVRGFIYTLPTELGTCPYLKTKFPDLPMWKSNQETMVDVACAVIYSTLSEKVRADGNVQDMMRYQDHGALMDYLDITYGPRSMECSDTMGDESMSEDELD